MTHLKICIPLNGALGSSRSLVAGGSALTLSLSVRAVMANNSSSDEGDEAF